MVTIYNSLIDVLSAADIEWWYPHFGFYTTGSIRAYSDIPTFYRTLKK